MLRFGSLWRVLQPHRGRKFRASRTAVRWVRSNAVQCATELLQVSGGAVNASSAHVIRSCHPLSVIRSMSSAQCHPLNVRGSVRNRCPVAANTAFATAGAIGGVPGSLMPPGGAVLGTKYTSIFGISFMRNSA